MERKLAKIAKVTGLFPIPGADFIEVAEIDGGWTVVVKKGEFKLEDLCVFFEIDSFLPVELRYEFLRKSSFKAFDGTEGFRLKSIRLKGQLSQGLAMPLKEEIFPELVGDTFPPWTIEEIGTDLTETLHIRKYEKPTSGKGILSGDAKGSFPNHTPKTDADRVQNNRGLIERNRDALVETTVKMNGSSFTCYLKDGVFGVCSRNLEKREGDNAFWRMARKYKLEERLKKIGRNISVQGEICGPGIQKNEDAFPEIVLRVFNVYDNDKQEPLAIHTMPDSWTDFVAQLNAAEEGEPIETVEILSVSQIFQTHSIKDLLLLAEGQSRTNPSKKREGIVFKFDYVGNAGKRIRHTLKAISNSKLLSDSDEPDENPDMEN